MCECIVCKAVSLAQTWAGKVKASAVAAKTEWSK